MPCAVPSTTLNEDEGEEGSEVEVGGGDEGEGEDVLQQLCDAKECASELQDVESNSSQATTKKAPSTVKKVQKILLAIVIVYWTVYIVM